MVNLEAVFIAKLSCLTLSKKDYKLIFLLKPRGVIVKISVED
jgi:hypothetical protein